MNICIFPHMRIIYFLSGHIFMSLLRNVYMIFKNQLPSHSALSLCQTDKNL